MNIKICDRIKLHRAVEILGNKARIINPEEIDMLKSMDSKIDKFAKLIQTLSAKQHSIQQQRKSMEMAVNFGFNALYETLDNRKELILSQLHEMMDQRSAYISQQIEGCNYSMKQAQTVREDCQRLVNTAIELDELAARTEKVDQSKRRITKIIKESVKQSAKTPSNDKISFLLDTKRAALFISKLGMFAEINYNIDSHILTEGDKIDLLNMLESQLGAKIELSLLYRMSKHGPSVADFHEFCDDQGATVTVIRSSHQHVFGGYTSKDWRSESVGSRVKDDNAFLFLLKSEFGHKQRVFPVCKREYGVYHDQSFGPVFGGHCAVALTTGNDGEFDGCVSPQDAAFNIVGNSLCGGDVYQADRKRYDFKIDDYEVFKVDTKSKKQRNKEITWRQFLSQTAGNTD